MDENIFYQQKASAYKFPIIGCYFFLHFRHFFTIDFFLIFKKKIVGKFFSNLLQNEPKKAILHLKK